MFGLHMQSGGGDTGMLMHRLSIIPGKRPKPIKNGHLIMSSTNTVMRGGSIL